MFVDTRAEITEELLEKNRYSFSVSVSTSIMLYYVQVLVILYLLWHYVLIEFTMLLIWFCLNLNTLNLHALIYSTYYNS